jgi:DNA polymerase I
MSDILHCYREIWLTDFEFRAPAGERPEPLCMVAREWRSGRTIRYWADQLLAGFPPPFGVGPDSLFVAYYASAELSCFHALDWPMPARILDLFAEFRCLTNGLRTPCGNGLLGASVYHGIDGIDAAEKDSMRNLALRGGPYTDTEKAALLDYCESDVLALARLLPAMLPKIDVPRALLRGRYMAAAAEMEHSGVPVDVDLLHRLQEHWGEIKAGLVREVDRDYGVFVPTGRGPAAESISCDGGEWRGPLSFSVARFTDWLVTNNIPWPCLPSGNLALDDDTFRAMAKSYPAVAPLRELRHTLSELRLFDLAVGSDGRNRCLLSAFQSTTGRNQPSNSRFIFGPSCWLRGLIRPEPGRAVAYVDWSQQEFGIAAALSGDSAMKSAYTSGDPYLAFAKQARAVPLDATKQSHSAVRDQFKVCALAVQYGMGSKSLAQSLGQSEAQARDLLRLHNATYRRFWQWSQSAVDHAMLRGSLQTVFGWQIQVGPVANPRSLANFPMQANGAEMLRLACCLATERGISVCAPIHDALLVEGPADEMDGVVIATQAAMQGASEIVLGGFALRSDAKIVRHPERYMDPRGGRMFRVVTGLLQGSAAPNFPEGHLNQNGPPTCTRVAYPYSLSFSFL